MLEKMEKKCTKIDPKSEKKKQKIDKGAGPKKWAGLIHIPTEQWAGLIVLAKREWPWLNNRISKKGRSFTKNGYCSSEKWAWPIFQRCFGTTRGLLIKKWSN